MIVIKSGDLSPSDYPPLPALRLYLGGYILEGDREIQTAVTLWLTTQDTDRNLQGMKNLAPRHNTTSFSVRAA